MTHLAQPIAPPWGSGGLRPPEAETLLLNERALFNAPLMKIVKYLLRAHI